MQNILGYINQNADLAALNVQAKTNENAQNELVKEVSNAFDLAKVEVQMENEKPVFEGGKLIFCKNEGLAFEYGAMRFPVEYCNANLSQTLT